MAVSDFYTANDLLVRRVYMASWICEQLSKFVNYYNYGETVSKECLIKHQYIVALLEAVSCYTPITLTTQDGVNNCLTEAKLDTIFDKVEDVTGLCFLAKGTTYDPNYDASIPLLIVALNGGGNLVGESGDDIDYNENQFGQ